MEATATEKPTRALVEKAQAGDRAAFDDLALRFRERLENQVGSRFASSPEVQAVGKAIERRRSEGSCGALLLETLSLIGESCKEASGAPAIPGK